MSCWRSQKVLRLPGEAFGVNTIEEWNVFKEKHKSELTWRVGGFGPALCSFKNGIFIDYILSDRAPIDGEGFTCRSYHLSEFEKEKYLPVFRRLFPDFTIEQMDAVHSCEYSWYDGVEAPDCY